MKTYNRSLDYITLAMASARRGESVQAARLFAKAIQEPDAVRAVAILEASNKQAFTASKLLSKRIKANDEFDMGGDDELDNLANDDSEVEAAFDDEEDGDDGEFDAQFAKVLSSLTRNRVRR